MSERIADKNAPVFKDHFTPHAKEYSEFRPRYPADLFEFLASVSPARDSAWDCGTGNGQAAVGLAERFARVIATDASAQQIAQATSHPRVEYRVAAAESSGIGDGSVDLVTVAQALHWFDVERFNAEARRALRPRGVVAVWCYTHLEVDPEIDRMVQAFYADVVGAYWPKERVHVETGYRDLPFPFEQLETPHFAMCADWDLGHLVGYLDTWSAVRIYRQQRGRDPLAALDAELANAWGRRDRVRRLRFPLHLRVGRLSEATR